MHLQFDLVDVQFMDELPRVGPWLPTSALLPQMLFRSLAERSGKRRFGFPGRGTPAGLQPLAPLLSGWHLACAWFHGAKANFFGKVAASPFLRT